MVGYLDVAGIEPNTAWERFTSEGPLALLPHQLGAQALNFVWCASPHRVTELQNLSNKFRELKSLVYDYRDKKDQEINELNTNHLNFKNEIEANHKKYEQLIDETADEISNFVEKAKLENVSQ